MRRFASTPLTSKVQAETCRLALAIASYAEAKATYNLTIHPLIYKCKEELYTATGIIMIEQHIKLAWRRTD